MTSREITTLAYLPVYSVLFSVFLVHGLHHINTFYVKLEV